MNLEDHVKQDLLEEHAKRIEVGDMAKRFLASKEWNELVEPIIDSMLVGLRDATTIDISSPEIAAVEVKARTEAAKYLESLKNLIKAYVIDADMSRKTIAPPQQADLYKFTE
jgi:hypothetical protein